MSELSDARSIFLKAIEVSDRNERAKLIQTACGEDSELRGRVDALLKAYDNPDSFYERPLSPGDAPTVLLPQLTERAGAMVGRYKLLQEIGEGGFGVVYMAEQTEPVHRKVALKIIKPGMDSRQVIARFEAERQALALMDHNNIARVLDADATETGLPYFVMELVKGVPITKYCDDNKLTPKQRLDLFIPVCQAVQHAHQKGVIHRDIKPSNVLVALHDGRPVPKVIDFGVAKATQQRLTERTMFTQMGQVIGTFEYMSPEQAEMNQLDIDTRSDIYSLGVLLYELLTGTTPITKQQFRKAGLVEMLRTIRETEPPRPSTRLSESGATLATISAARKTEPDRLTRLLRGDLDWIVMKALEKDRSRRYDSANNLAADIERHLNNEPVLAAAPSTAYRFRKFIGRNKTAVATAMMIALLLLGFGVVSMFQAQLARRSAERARLAEQEARQSLDRVQQARAAAELDRVRAVSAETMATASKEEALDQVARSLYEQARAVRLSDQTGGRGRALDLLAQAESLRSRYGTTDRTEQPSLAAESRTEAASITEDVQASRLPSLADLCSEALAAFQLRDVQLIAESGASAVGAQCVSPDGYAIANLTLDMSNRQRPIGALSVVEFATGRKLGEFHNPEKVRFLPGMFSNGALSPRGKLLAVVPSSKLHLWDVADQTELRVLDLPADWPERPIPHLEFSPDGTKIAYTAATVGGQDNCKLAIIHVDDSPPQTAEASQQRWFDFRSDSQAILFPTATDEVTHWDLSSDERIKINTEPRALATYAGKEDTIYTTHWAAGTGGKMQSTVRRHTVGAPDTKEVASVDDFMTYSIDAMRGRIALGGQRGRLVVLDGDSGELLVDIKDAHPVFVQRVMWLDDGKQLLSMGQIGAARLWRLDVDSPVSALSSSIIGQGYPHCAFSPNGKLMAVSLQDAISAHTNLLTADLTTFSKDIDKYREGKLPSGETRLIDRQSGSLIQTLSFSGTPVFSHSGEKLAVVDFAAAQVWEVATGKLIDSYTAPKGEIMLSGAFSDVGDLWVTCNREVESRDGESVQRDDDQTLLLVRNVSTGSDEWQDEPDNLNKVAYLSPQARHVVIDSSPEDFMHSEDSNLTVREVSSGKTVAKVPHEPLVRIAKPTLSSEGRWLIMTRIAGLSTKTNEAGASELVVWDIRADRQHHVIKPTQFPPSFAVSQDGQLLAYSAPAGEVVIINVETTEPLVRWHTGFDRCSQVVFTHGSAALAVAGGVNTGIKTLDLGKFNTLLEPLGLAWHPR